MPHVACRMAALGGFRPRLHSREMESKRSVRVVVVACGWVAKRPLDGVEAQLCGSSSSIVDVTRLPSTCLHTTRGQTIELPRSLKATQGRNPPKPGTHLPPSSAGAHFFFRPANPPSKSRSQLPCPGVLKQRSSCLTTRSSASHSASCLSSLPRQIECLTRCTLSGRYKPQHSAPG